MNKITLLLCSVLLFACAEQSSEETKNQPSKTIAKKIDFRPPSDFFPKKKTQVLVVGTFHMDYPGLDSHKTSESDKIDVLKEPKKSEVSQLVEYIKKFKPTKIAIEAGTSWKAVEKLKAYKDGEYRDQRDERYQIAMRIANDLKFDTLYNLDAHSLSQDMYRNDSIAYNSYTGAIDWEREDASSTAMYDWFDYNDIITKEAPLLDYFKYMNSPESHAYGYGIYLTGGFKTENNQGADHLSMWWYNRNLRIFRKLTGITDGPEDRIMILMGNGHAAVLRQLIKVSPEYDFIEFDSLD